MEETANSKSSDMTVGRVRPQLAIPFGPDAKLDAWHDLAKRLKYPRGGTPLARRILEEFMAAHYEAEDLEKIGLVEHTVQTGGWLRKAVGLLDTKEQRQTIHLEMTQGGRNDGYKAHKNPKSYRSR